MPAQRRQLDLLAKLNNLQMEREGPDPTLEANIQTSEIAFRMQAEAPDVFDITKEPEAVRARYGDHDFGRGCLMARRLVERGYVDEFTRRFLTKLDPGPIADQHQFVVCQAGANFDLFRGLQAKRHASFFETMISI